MKQKINSLILLWWSFLMTLLNKNMTSQNKSDDMVVLIYYLMRIFSYNFKKNDNDRHCLWSRFESKNSFIYVTLMIKFLMTLLNKNIVNKTENVDMINRVIKFNRSLIFPSCWSFRSFGQSVNQQLHSFMLIWLTKLDALEFI